VFLNLCFKNNWLQQIWVEGGKEKKMAIPKNRNEIVPVFRNQEQGEWFTA